MWVLILQVTFQNKTSNVGGSSKVCSLCDRTFSTVSNLNQHMRVTHHKKYPYRCQICGKGTRSYYALQSHNASQHGMPVKSRYTCQICGEGMAEKREFLAHMVNVHNVWISSKNNWRSLLLQKWSIIIIFINC